MSTPIPRTGRSPGTSFGRGPLHALVAAGSSSPGRRVLLGELVWIPSSCGRAGCSCTALFGGVVSHGVTDVAVVRAFTGVRKAELRRAIAAGMCRHCIPPTLAPARADRLLRTAADLPEGTLVHRDAAGAIVPFPDGATITSTGRVVWTAPGASR